jgi:hypothetical protein
MTAALAALLVGGANASAGSTERALIPGCGGTDVARYKPRTVVLTCGDGGFRATRLSWDTWTERRAEGSGTAKVNNCKPSCAEGKFESFKVELVARRPRTCPGGKRQFKRLDYSFPGSKPAGARRDGTLRRGCSR